MVDTKAIRDRYVVLSSHLDERGRRSFAAGEARAAGYGGIAGVSRATGIAASTIGRGLKELACASGLSSDRVRRPGGGHKSLVATNATLLEDLLALVSPSERGDPRASATTIPDRVSPRRLENRLRNFKEGRFMPWVLRKERQDGGGESRRPLANLVRCPAGWRPEEPPGFSPGPGGLRIKARNHAALRHNAALAPYLAPR
jgi:hypothetical protein